MAKLKVLFFITTSKPTNYDRQAASTMNAAVSYRNVNLVKPDDKAEDCDAVMGVIIPAQYKDKPDAKTALAAKPADVPAAVSAQPPVFAAAASE